VGGAEPLDMLASAVMFETAPNWDKVDSSAEAIRKGLDEWTTGWANQTALQELRRHIVAIRDATVDDYIREKVGSLSAWLDILFSPRKHLKYGGEEQVKQHARTDCYKIHTYATSRQRHGEEK
jgi:hypothetical protein